MHEPRSFITTVPHMSFVWGDENVNFLRARYTALQQSTLFRGMRYSEDHAQIKEWAPLVMEGRDPQQKVAATRTEIGTDVNYGEITRQLITSLQKKPNFALQLSTEVRGFKRNADNSWTVTVADLKNNEAEHDIKAKFVFIGAGGAALKLLQETDIPEAKGYAGFPVGAQFPLRKTRMWSIATWRKCTVRPPLARRRCLYRISTPVSLMASALCCLGHSRHSPPSS